MDTLRGITTRIAIYRYINLSELKLVVRQK